MKLQVTTVAMMTFELDEEEEYFYKEAVEEDSLLDFLDYYISKSKEDSATVVHVDGVEIYPGRDAAPT